MERAMSAEDKIRRAQEIYARKHDGKINQTSQTRVNNTKDFKLLKKMIIQIIICVLIYVVIYVIQNSNYIFSQDFLKKANEIISYDTNFVQIFENVKNGINGVITNINGQQEKQKTDESIGGAIEGQQSDSVIEENTKTQNEQELSQTDIDIQTAKNTTSYIKPIEGTVSSSFGQREPSTATVPKNHTGMDIAAPQGTKILAATDGEVVLRSEEGDYGKHLKIQIGEISIIYAHCSNLLVNQGDKIKQGQEIAEVGSTGNSTGPHLHFEVRVSERIIDPQTILEN